MILRINTFDLVFLIILLLKIKENILDLKIDLKC